MKKELKVLVYDDACPLCSAYTNAFVKTGILQPAGRKCFAKLDTSVAEHIDMARGSNEIPLVNMETGEVKYGIEAMTDLLGARWPWITKLLSVKWIHWFFLKLYKLISYNRRVITATAFTQGNFNCTPDFNYKYRFAFMLMGLLFNSLMLVPVHAEVFAHTMFNHTSSLQLQMAHFALVLTNVLLACTLSPAKAFEFLGQVNMLAILANLLLVPLILLNKYFIAESMLNNILLFINTGFIVKEYIRRMKYAGIILNRVIVPVNVASIILFLAYLIL